MTIQQIQAAIDSKANDPRQLINMIADYLQANPVGGGGSSYLVYTALLNQTGTNAPNATVLENTLGGLIVWTRTGDGVYKGTLAGAFTVGKTFIHYGSDWSGDGYFLIPVTDGGVLAGYYSITNSNANEILIQITDNPITSNVDWSTLATTSNFPIEIRVYP